MRKLLILTLAMLILTGCTSLNNMNIDRLVKNFLSNNNSLSNVVFDGYKYYVPRGVKLVTKDEYNALLLDEYNNTYHFYVDVVSYYTKTKLHYKKNNRLYFSSKLYYNNKEGYLEINDLTSSYYFVEYMYNYGKIEAYVKKDNLNSAIINMSNILSSIKFNRTVLATIIGNKELDYKKDSYDVMKPKGNKATKDTYLEYEEKYGIYEGYSENDLDEDKIKIDEE